MMILAMVWAAVGIASLADWRFNGIDVLFLVLSVILILCLLERKRDARR